MDMHPVLDLSFEVVRGLSSIVNSWKRSDHQEGHLTELIKTSHNLTSWIWLLVLYQNLIFENFSLKIGSNIFYETLSNKTLIRTVTNIIKIFWNIYFLFFTTISHLFQKILDKRVWTSAGFVWAQCIQFGVFLDYEPNLNW